MSFRLHPTKNKKLASGEDRYYQFEIYQGKDRITVVKQLPNESAAMLYDAELKRAVRPAVATLVAPTLNQILPEFLDWYKLHRQPRSLEAWLDGWKNLEPHFGRLRPNLLTPALIDQYKLHRLQQRAGRKQSTISKRTVTKELANLSALVTFAVDRDLCEPLPFKIKGFTKKQTQPPQKTIPSPEQIQALLQHTRPDVRPLYTLIYYAGLRSEEARTLRARQIDLERGLISVTGKGNKQRIVPIAEPLKPVLQQAMQNKQPDDVLMISRRSGKPYSRNIGRLDGAARRAGITSHITAHTLRHCFGTHAIYWGIDLRTVQMLMGHSDSTTTEIYTNLAATFLTDQMKRFGNIPNEKP